MQIGGLIFAKASKEEGRIHSPSPQINPEATAGIIKVAFLLFILCHANTMKLPKLISMAKLAPTKNGTAMAIGKGTHLPYLTGRRSLITLAAAAKPKKP